MLPHPYGTLKSSGWYFVWKVTVNILFLPGGRVKKIIQREFFPAPCACNNRGHLFQVSFFWTHQLG
jgi:hypothetical protein